MQRWISRFSFTFIAIAGVLCWEIYNSLKGTRGPVSKERLALYMIACVLAIVMGAIGIRARHRGAQHG
jgi:hypothetical protein